MMVHGWRDGSIIHAGNPLIGEYTLCGEAFDEPATERSGLEMQATQELPNCPQCLLVIRVAGAIARKLDE